MAALASGDTKIRAQQARIDLQITHLREEQQLRRDFETTHIDPTARLDVGDLMESLRATESSSPRTKFRLAERAKAQPTGSLTNSMSIAESMDLQRQAVAREREAAARRARQLEMDTERKNVGNKLKESMKNNPEMSGFMFHEDSDDEELDDGGGDFGLSGDLDEGEEGSLNPYRAAYESGYERAEAESRAPG